jgi:hypothetical protein
MNHFELHNTWYGINNDIAQPGVSYVFNECYFRSNQYGLQLNADLVYNNCIFESNGVGQAAQISYGSLTATNCQFLNNFCSFTWSNNINVNNCLFSGNQNNIIGSPGIIQNSQFYNNTFGMTEISNITVNQCVFDGNGTGIDGSSTCVITNSTFTNNSIAVKIGDASTVSQNTITDNSIGVQVLGYDPNTTSIDSNLICNNSVHNLENLTDKNYQVNLNCFCSQDSTIIENGIFDGYDDITRGLVNYAIYDDSCQTVVSYVTKIDLGGPAGLTALDEQWNTWFDGESLVIENNIPGIFSIYDIQGTRIMNATASAGLNKISLTLPQGLYLVGRQGGVTQKVFIGN